MVQSNGTTDLIQERPDDNRPASATPPVTAAYAPTPTVAKHDAFAAVRVHDFRLYILGWIFNVIGDQITEVAVAWELYQRTHDAMTLGWVGLVVALPLIFLALPAGQIADKFNRRKVVLLCQAVRAMCIVTLGILAFSHGAIPLIYSVLFIAAVSRAVGWPARSAMLPALVPEGMFPNAINWNSNAFELSSIIGPGIGGLLVHWSTILAFGCAATCSALYVLTILLIRPRENVASKEPATLRSVAAGVKYVLDTKIILATMTLDLFAVLLGGATYLLPIFATDILKVGATGFGWLRAAPGIGALLMGVTIAFLPPMKRAGRAMLIAVAGFGIATIAFGLSHNFWLSMAMLFMTGVCDNISVLVRHTLVQVLTPDAMRGRVSAVNNIFVGSSNELGGFESGLTAKLFGPRTSVIGGGIGTLVVVGIVAAVWPQVRRFGSLVNARPENANQEPAAVPS